MLSSTRLLFSCMFNRLRNTLSFAGCVPALTQLEDGEEGGGDGKEEETQAGRQAGAEQNVCSIEHRSGGNLPPRRHSLLNAHTHKNVGVYCHCVARRPPTQWQMELWFHAHTHKHTHTTYMHTYTLTHRLKEIKYTISTKDTQFDCAIHIVDIHAHDTQHTLTSENLLHN